MAKQQVFVKCSHCEGKGRVPKYKEIRIKCKDCIDHKHGCFGSGKSNGLGYSWCVKYKKVYKDV